MTDPQPSALRLVARTPFYRSAFLALLLSGVGVSATMPQLTLFLVRDLGASLPVAGLYYLQPRGPRGRLPGRSALRPA